MQVLRAASHTVSEFFAWQGRFFEATRHYETMVGSLEEFEGNEQVLRASLIGGKPFHLRKTGKGSGHDRRRRAKAKPLSFDDVIHYCDFWSAACLCEIQKVSDEELISDRVLALPEGEVGHHLAWAVCSCKAYILAEKDKCEEAFKWLQKSVEHRRSIGMTYSPASWHLKSLSIMESKGFRHEEMTFDAEINRMLAWTIST